jgi:predicted nucleotidyltransferase
MIRKDIKNKIKDYFAANPTRKLRVREIEREVKVPLPSAIRYSRELVREGYLQAVKVSNVTFYCADRSSKQFVWEKKLINLRKIYESGLTEFLIDKLGNPAVVLFGSFSRGEDIEGSDIDLFVETPSKAKVNLAEYEAKLKRRIQLFSYRRISEVKNKELANNIINGVVLNGFLEVL